MLNLKEIGKGFRVEKKGKGKPRVKVVILDDNSKIEFKPAVELETLGEALKKSLAKSKFVDQGLSAESAERIVEQFSLGKKITKSVKATKSASGPRKGATKKLNLEGVQTWLMDNKKETGSSRPPMKAAAKYFDVSVSTLRRFLKP